jgi:Flp pilus assembly protein TadD
MRRSAGPREERASSAVLDRGSDLVSGLPTWSRTARSQFVGLLSRKPERGARSGLASGADLSRESSGLDRRIPSPTRRAPAAQALARVASLRQQGRFREAVEAMRLAASLEPNSATIFHDLGLICLEAGMPAEAVGSLRRAAQLKPTFAHAFWCLGMALELCGEINSAADALRKATELQPRLPEAQFRLGSILEQLGHRHEAGERFRRVLTGGPPARLRRLAEARALLIEDRDQEAERKLRRAAEIEPSDVETLTLLGFVLTYAGAFEEAASSFERALAQPERGQLHLYYDLVRCRKITPRDDALLQRLRSAAAESRRADDTSVKLQLALGKALDDLGQYGEAMQAFDAAADIRARASPFDVAAFEQRVDKIIETFSGEFLAGKRSVGNPDPTPALIFGMPRSGTTLCEQIVSSHPSAHGAGELHFWNRRGAMMEAVAMNVGDEFFIQAAEDCLRHLRERSGEAARITDKNPFNFQWAGLVHIVFPRAALIHCRRSPIDTALSIHQTFFSDRVRLPTGGSELVRYYRAYERLMDHWRQVLPSDRFLEVDYEDLTATPEETARRMIAHVGLEWDDRCLQPEKNTRRVKTASRWQVRQPIYRSSVERWRRYEPYLGALADLAPE